MERGGKSATGGATPLWLRRMARATLHNQSGVAVPPAGLDSAAALHMARPYAKRGAVSPSERR